jgi:hypothetical protein
MTAAEPLCDLEMIKADYRLVGTKTENLTIVFG